MKVGMPESAVEVHPPLSPISSLRMLGLTDIRGLYQLHIEYLATQMPMVAAWIVYQDMETHQRQLVVRYTQPPFCSYLDFSYLQAEVWIPDSLPVLSLTEVEFEPKCQVAANEACSGIPSRPSSASFYACSLGENESNFEYLLLWTAEPLSECQKQSVEQQLQILCHSLAVYRECSRQRTEIQLLEHQLRKAEHQLRNPLALIALYAENLCLGLPAGSLQEQATVIRDTVNQLNTHLTDLIDCGQKSKLRVAPCDLRRVWIESVQGLQPWLDEKHLCVNCPDKPLSVAVDRWQIKQVFDNLLSNAVHFSPVGGTISCRWQVFRYEVLIEVADQGPGLSEEDLRQAFTPFYSRRSGGTGLGLAIAKKIALDHQGNLWVQNLPKGGAQFSLSLPRKLKITN